MIHLPGHPPSANRLYIRPGRGGRTVKTADYRRWLDGAALACLASGVRLPDGPWAIEMVVDGLNRRRDLDNTLKPLLDCLVRSGAVPDDRYLDRILVERGPLKADPAVHLIPARWPT